jgi:hypothetical protein
VTEVRELVAGHVQRIGRHLGRRGALRRGLILGDGGVAHQVLRAGVERLEADQFIGRGQGLRGTPDLQAGIGQGPEVLGVVRLEFLHGLAGEDDRLHHVQAMRRLGEHLEGGGAGRIGREHALGAGDGLERVLRGAREDEGRGREPANRLADDIIAFLEAAELRLPVQTPGLDAAGCGLEDLGAGLECVGVIADPERGAGVLEEFLLSGWQRRNRNVRHGLAQRTPARWVRQCRSRPRLA